MMMTPRHDHHAFLFLHSLVPVQLLLLLGRSSNLSVVSNLLLVFIPRHTPATRKAASAAIFNQDGLVIAAYGRTLGV